MITQQLRFHLNSMFLGFVLIAPHTLAGQTFTPLTEQELILIFQRPDLRNNPSHVLHDFVEVNKIAFLPTRAVRSRLVAAGVPQAVTNQLRYNFASRVTYRVCTFEGDNTLGSQLAATVSDQLSEHRIVWKTPTQLLADKSFDPVLCPSTGPTRQEVVADPHNSVLAVLGRLESTGGNQWRMTAHLVFFSPSFQRMEVTSRVFPFAAVAADLRRVAKEIAHWSIQAAEVELQ